MKVGYIVSGCKTAEDTGVMDGVRCGYIDDLEIHFGGISSFVTTKLHPHFSLGYDAVMPGKQSNTMSMCMYTSPLLTDISIPYLWLSSNICITFCLRSGMQTSGAPRSSSPPELRQNESGATSPCEGSRLATL